MEQAQRQSKAWSCSMARHETDYRHTESQAKWNQDPQHHIGPSSHYHTRHQVTYAALDVCTMNTSVLSCHGDEVPPTMIVTLSRLTPLHVGWTIWILHMFTNFFSSFFRKNSILAPWSMGILMMDMAPMTIQACGLSRQMMMQVVLQMQPFSIWILCNYKLRLLICT